MSEKNLEATRGFEEKGKMKGIDKSKCLPIEEKVCCFAIQLGDPVHFLIIIPPHFLCFGVNECREIMTLVKGITSVMDD